MGCGNKFKNNLSYINIYLIYIFIFNFSLVFFHECDKPLKCINNEIKIKHDQSLQFRNSNF